MVGWKDVPLQAYAKVSLPAEVSAVGQIVYGIGFI